MRVSQITPHIQDDRRIVNFLQQGRVGRVCLGDDRGSKGADAIELHLATWVRVARRRSILRPQVRFLEHCAVRSVLPRGFSLASRTLREACSHGPDLRAAACSVRRRPPLASWFRAHTLITGAMQHGLTAAKRTFSGASKVSLKLSVLENVLGKLSGRFHPIESGGGDELLRGRGKSGEQMVTARWI